MKLKACILIIFWLGCLNGWAQPKKWTLDECINYGVKQSLQMQRQQLQNINERLGVRDAALNLIPYVNGISPYVSYNYGRGIDPETNIYTNVRNNTVGGFNVGGGLTLFAGFSGINRLRAARVAKFKGLEETESLANDLAIQIMNAFFTLVYAEERVQVTQEQLENASMQLKKMQREYELGQRPKSDLFDMQAQQASYEYQLISCQNDRSNALVSLKHFMNYKESEELAVDLALLSVIIPMDEKTEIQQLYEKALKELPEAIIAGYNVRINKLNLYTTRASLFPSIEVNGGVSFGYYSNQSSGSFWSQVTDKNRIGKNFGFSMSIPIFNGLGRQSNVRRAKNNYENARIQYEQTEQSIYTEIQKAVLDMESGVQQYKMALKKEEYSTLSYNAGKKRYEQGLITIIDLNTTSNNLLQSKYDLLKARLDYVMRKRMVEFYKGVPIQTIVK